MQTEFFLPDFQLRKTTCITTIFHTKIACYQPRISMQIGTFFPRFLAQKNSMHFYHFHTKNCMLSTKKNKHANWTFFFPDFQLRKTACISTIFHTKNCMLSTKNKHANWNFFFLGFHLRKTECISTIFHTKNCMLSTKKNKHASWTLFFPNF